MSHNDHGPASDPHAGHKMSGMHGSHDCHAGHSGLDPAAFDLKTFRSTYATRMLRQGFDVRTVQDWRGHQSLKTTMRYLVPATDVHDRLDEIEIPGVIESAIPKKAPGSERQSVFPRKKMRR